MLEEDKRNPKEYPKKENTLIPTQNEWEWGEEE